MEYTLKRSARARALRLAVHPDGAVVVTAPDFFSLRAIEQFLAKYSKWVERKVEATKSKHVIYVTREDIAALKQKALALAQERSAHYADVYGVTFKKISIRAQKARWGSCSHTGNLSFNYKIAALPSNLAHYIIVHEICHLLEMNHSVRFWRQVTRAIPQHKTVRKELRNTIVIFK